jgi:hypothetical protein
LQLPIKLLILATRFIGRLLVSPVYHRQWWQPPAVSSAAGTVARPLGGVSLQQTAWKALHDYFDGARCQQVREKPSQSVGWTGPFVAVVSSAQLSFWWLVCLVVCARSCLPQLVQAIVLKLLIFTPADLEQWETDPETFIQLEEDTGSDSYMCGGLWLRCPHIIPRFQLLY